LRCARRVGKNTFTVGNGHHPRGDPGGRGRSRETGISCGCLALAVVPQYRASQATGRAGAVRPEKASSISYMEGAFPHGRNLSTWRGPFHMERTIPDGGDHSTWKGPFRWRGPFHMEGTIPHRGAFPCGEAFPCCAVSRFSPSDSGGRQRRTRTRRQGRCSPPCSAGTRRDRNHGPGPRCRPDARAAMRCPRRWWR
jgi:hypothetical protein